MNDKSLYINRINTIYSSLFLIREGEGGGGGGGGGGGARGLGTTKNNMQTFISRFSYLNCLVNAGQLLTQRESTIATECLIFRRLIRRYTH